LARTEESERSPGYRTAVRWALLFAGVLTAAARVPELHRYYVQWQALAGADASAAEAYKKFFEVESGIAVFVVAMGVALFFALRPRQKKPE
jgi:hypothetical protein